MSSRSHSHDFQEGQRNALRVVARIIGGRRRGLAALTRSNIERGHTDTTYNDGRRDALRDLARSIYFRA